MEQLRLDVYGGNPPLAWPNPANYALDVKKSTWLLMLLTIGSAGLIGQAQSPDGDVAGTTVLTRGPVHEAFAGVVAFNPEPGVVVTKTPPASIEEMPPSERPEGDNVTWIPGYWAWDDERSDYLWVSGTWRALPPGRAWMAGYWGKTSQGYQWTSGYWADAAAKETTYLPAPPATVEAGPNIAAPSDDYGWSPGCWVWYSGRYAWQPGYWVLGRADWDWCPGHYVWTPRGYIFVGGFWDYPVERRGILFAPVYFESGVYARRGYRYSPTIVIDLGVFSDHLFLRPRYSHYYFGDYYAASYIQGGFYASFSFQSSRYGYDPIYSHQRWEHRQDRDWEHRVEASYQNRRDHEAARPPRTWAAERNLNSGAAESRQNRMATPIDQLAKRTDGAQRFQPVAKKEQQALAQRGQEVQRSRDDRRTVEAKAGGTNARNPGGAVEPALVKTSRSPIVAKPVSQLRRDQAPPSVQSASRPESKAQPRAEAPGQPPRTDRNNSPAERRQLEPTKQSVPERSDAVPREKPVQAQPQPRAKESEAQVQEQPQQNAGGKAQRESDQRTKDPVMPVPKINQVQSEPREPITPAPEFKPATRSESTRTPAIKEPVQTRGSRQVGQQMRPSRPVDNAVQPSPRENPTASGRNEPNPPDRDRDKKNKD